MAMMSFVCGLGGVLLFTILAPALQAIARRTGSSVAPVALLAIAAVISHITCVVLGAVLPVLEHCINLCLLRNVVRFRLRRGL
jgi:hypothetical protein